MIFGAGALSAIGGSLPSRQGPGDDYLGSAAGNLAARANRAESDQGGGGFPLLPVALAGGAVAAVLLLRRKG